MHVIRLRKPWTKTLDDGVQTFQVDVPEQTVADPEADEVLAHYQRRFNRPSGLYDARVYLRITGWQGHLTSLSLNGTRITADECSDRIDVEVTPLLQAHNQLLVTLSGKPGMLPRLSGEVTLGIEERPVN